AQIRHFACFAISIPLSFRDTGGDDSNLTQFSNRPAPSLMFKIAEEFEEGGREEVVAEFEGVAARAAQPVRLLQLPRDPLLRGQAWKLKGEFLQQAGIESWKVRA